MKRRPKKNLSLRQIHFFVLLFLSSVPDIFFLLCTDVQTYSWIWYIACATFGEPIFVYALSIYKIFSTSIQIQLTSSQLEEKCEFLPYQFPLCESCVAGRDINIHICKIRITVNRKKALGKTTRYKCSCMKSLTHGWENECEMDDKRKEIWKDFQFLRPRLLFWKHRELMPSWRIFVS